MTADENGTAPCAGVRVVEVAVGVSDLGLGMAGGVPGMILADLGASVVRVVGEAPLPIDSGVSWGRAWHRDKEVIRTDDPRRVLALLADADVALVYGSETVVEQSGLGYLDVQPLNPTLVYARCRPSRTSKGTIADYGLLVEANAGFCTQLDGNRPGPIFVDCRASGSGTALLMTASALALLRRRVVAGVGGWAETSLYDGMLATLVCMIGRSERAAPKIEEYWEQGSFFPRFLYRCADRELIQVWFGGKGMYAKLIDVLGDQPSPAGYYTDQVTGALNARAVRWRETFTQRPRNEWITLLRSAGVACEPVLRPGEALSDPHLTEAALTVTRSEGGHRDVLIATPITVRPLASTDGQPEAEPPAYTANDRPSGRGLLAGVHVLDFSAFVAGPLGAQVLADMGADVIKVEPPGGEAMRAAAYAVAACQRGKRSLTIDLNAAQSRPVVERLFSWADVVLHNFSVGVAERLGIDAKTVARINPRAVYCHASSFGPTGPRATFPGSDALMQAFTGLARAVGGDGNDPVAPTWIPLDVSGGWVAADGILAGLYAQATSGRGQLVATSLLGAGMLLQSGVFQRDGEDVRGPVVDADQTGYGPGYRLYQGGDGRWFALVLPDERAWSRLGALGEVTGLPASYTPLRGGAHDERARRAEAVLAAAFATRPAAEWVALLRRHDLPAELVKPMNRDDFRRAVLDDPVNRQLGRVAAYHVAEWGHFEQIGALTRCGPGADGDPAMMVPGIGEHSVEVLNELGFRAEEIDALLAEKVVRQS
ncbi:CoA transferase [Frankia sp. AgB1.9]|uniref:CoA transferase n=1 Tax=unclassified Frankia TaxID=2632575 RepID=UPI00193266A6|nr:MULTISPECIES: CoA transferase [unclassified Frankia]MBL7493269.1 CoA transferase [Frankia sp. AgW1.1]MBL7553789.1 CoA transferase [Frankia sp. AgB1.9]MBL7622749.1 CoA transferase [Frankia sp. AgB1.8]